MKSGNKFLVWAMAFSLKKRRELMYCWFGGLLILFCVVGVVICLMFGFVLVFVPLIAFISAFLIMFLVRNLFFDLKIIIQLQLDYLLKQKDERGLEKYKDFVDEEWKDDSESKKADDYKEIAAAIDHLLQLQTVLG